MNDAGKTRAPMTPLGVIRWSVIAAIATITLKMVAWRVTDSVGMLSDALESFVNLAGALFALRMLTWAQAPPDAEHPFGHAKGEYVSSGFEGLLILGAAFGIAWTAVGRLLVPAPLEALDIGVAVAIVASLINFAVARALTVAARHHRSPALEADARHLLTDVWTTGGLIAGLGLVALSGETWIDPVLALLVAANIVREAVRLLRRSFDGLVDRALEPAERDRVNAVLAGFAAADVVIASVITRRAGPAAFVTVVVRVPGTTPVASAHVLADAIENALASNHPGLVATVHVEPLPAPA